MKLKKKKANELKSILLKINDEYATLQKALTALDNDIDVLWGLAEDLTGESICAGASEEED